MWCGVVFHGVPAVMGDSYLEFGSMAWATSAHCGPRLPSRSGRRCNLGVQMMSAGITARASAAPLGGRRQLEHGACSSQDGALVHSTQRERNCCMFPDLCEFKTYTRIRLRMGARKSSGLFAQV